ncbi:hypothetical protein B224_3521 [Aeromonas media WS]|nr:hypothetical protein B224_3521 [Aeromonas media WS]
MGCGHFTHSGMENGLSHGRTGEENRAGDCTPGASQSGQLYAPKWTLDQRKSTEFIP